MQMCPPRLWARVLHVSGESEFSGCCLSSDCESGHLRLSSHPASAGGCANQGNQQRLTYTYLGGRGGGGNVRSSAGNGGLGDEDDRVL